MSDHQVSLAKASGRGSDACRAKEAEVTLRLILRLSDELAAQSSTVQLQTIDLRLVAHKISERCSQALSELVAQQERENLTR
jgi:hypothetical protein